MKVQTQWLDQLGAQWNYVHKVVCRNTKNAGIDVCCTNTVKGIYLSACTYTRIRGWVQGGVNVIASSGIDSK
jgi:hypothetical protein